MSDESRSAQSGAEPEIKVVDRRRFHLGDEETEGSGSKEAAPREDHTGETIAPEGPDERDMKLAEQASRIDELTRAYASLVEEGKAFRLRQERERVRVVDAERAVVAQALLETADDLERALSATSSAPEGTTAVETLAQGVRLSLNAIQKRIAGLGAERFSVVGQRFDPHVAEAVDALTVNDADQDGVVVEEVQAGYRIGDRVLRPARVRVGRLACA